MARTASSRLVKSKGLSSASSTPAAANTFVSSPRGKLGDETEPGIVRYSLQDLAGMPDTTDWERLERMTDEEIEAAVRDDPDAGPFELDEDFWKNARVVLPPSKELISIRVDKDVLDWFRSLGRGYQTRMNMVLRSFMEHQLKKPQK
jgi:uncharacterized protein (DUF4415 family)